VLCFNINRINYFQTLIKCALKRVNEDATNYRALSPFKLSNTNHFLIGDKARLMNNRWR